MATKDIRSSSYSNVHVATVCACMDQQGPLVARLTTTRVAANQNDRASADTHSLFKREAIRVSQRWTLMFIAGRQFQRINVAEWQAIKGSVTT